MPERPETRAPPKNASPLNSWEIKGVIVYVKCPVDHEISEKIIFANEFSQEVENALCPRDKMWRAIRLAEVKEELRKLL